MVGLRIRVVMVVMIMPVIMIVVMAMPVMVMMVMIMGHVQSTFAGAECCAKITIFNITARGGNTFAFNMVVMAFLRQADFIFKAQHLRTIFTH